MQRAGERESTHAAGSLKPRRSSQRKKLMGLHLPFSSTVLGSPIILLASAAMINICIGILYAVLSDARSCSQRLPRPSVMLRGAGT
jgi:hypothetical protein